ncbi:MAG: carbohydrate-binding protein [Firmicutes bacterium]|nr:carbohydrate-binding protein [Bacillota bacterium]
MMTGKQEPGGITINPYPLNAGELVTVTYNGLLAQSGADQVYLHMGYGDGWHNTQDLKMQKTQRGWEKSFSLTEAGSLNLCFKDSANNWDNNNGKNWTYPIDNPRFTT